MFFTDISQHEINGTNHMRAATALPEEAQNGKISNTHTMLKVYIEKVTGRRWKRREGEAGAKN